MARDRINFFFLNLGHLFDHLFMLIFATVAALALATEWGMTYGELIPYAMPGFVAFGIASIPAGWLADKWSRTRMMNVFFLGAGAASIATGFATTPLQIGAGLLVIGLFAAIYHPVGIAMVVHGRVKTGMPLAINGVFGNLGVASAALVTGVIIDLYGWRTAFIAPGVFALGLGIAYWTFQASDKREVSEAKAQKSAGTAAMALDRNVLVLIFAIIFFTTALGGLIFQSTTFALPKIFDERLGNLATSATEVGAWAFMVFTVAAFAQLVVGYLVDNHSVRTVFAFVAGLQAILFFLMLELTGVAALVVSVGFMLVVFGQIPINDVLIGRIAKSEWRSRAYAVRSFITFTVMASSVPMIAWLHATWGFTALFMVMCGVAVLIFLAVLKLPRTGAVLARAASPAE
ncbi:MAG: MFS transporter [Alphaproteobacteria bacterium]|jgi:MFS family permease|nr:MFS transporter [Alphaproteobacteria bacterium]|tara:strand:+ start:815 stop:2023 length:1209 start_codon:yes stop_codon:yes gene_type:complete